MELENNFNSFFFLHRLYLPVLVTGIEVVNCTRFCFSIHSIIVVTRIKNNKVPIPIPIPVE